MNTVLNPDAFLGFRRGRLSGRGGLPLLVLVLLFLLPFCGFLLALFQRLFYVFGRLVGLTLGIDGVLGLALVSGFHLRALLFGIVGVPPEKLQLPFLKIGLYPRLMGSSLPSSIMPFT